MGHTAHHPGPPGKETGVVRRQKKGAGGMDFIGDHTHSDRGQNPQPRYVPSPGIEPVTL